MTIQAALLYLQRNQDSRALKLKTKLKNLQVKLQDFSIIVRKIKKLKRHTLFNLTLKGILTLYESQVKFLAFRSFFPLQNLTFPPYYNYLLFGIPSHPPFNKRVSEQRDE